VKIKLVNDWEKNTAIEAVKEFTDETYGRDPMDGVKAEDMVKDMDWLFGSYTYESYSGDAFMLFKKDEKIFEVSGGHCSCYGLEGQWKPEETTLETISHRLKIGELGKTSYGNEFANELETFLSEVAQ
jgi:hypothetical protein